MKALPIGLAGVALLTASLALAQAPATGPSTEATPSTAAAPSVPAKKLSYTDDYRISVNHDAESDGEIVFRVTPKEGTAKDITVAIKKGTSENDVAGVIKKAFVEQLGTKEQNIEMEDGENVIIERSMGEKDISLVLVSSTVKGASVTVHRD
jgi:hypothetical protein